MKLVKFKITPKSTFASLPSADMIFGHFAKFLYLEKDNRLDNYLEKPSIIFSDFLPDGYLYKPTLPLECFKVNEDEKKEFRKKQFISIENLQNGEFSKCEEINFFEKKQVVKNSISRISFTTEKEIFTPYSLEEIEFKTDICMYVLFDNFTLEEIKERLNLIGKSGFGKKSSIGKGQFEVEIDETFKGFKTFDTNYYITLSSAIFNGVKNAFYDVWTKFGKFHSSNTPFKKPVVFAKPSAIIKTDKKEYIGKAVDNGYNEISFVSGYSIIIPIKDLPCKIFN